MVVGQLARRVAVAPAVQRTSKYHAVCTNSLRSVTSRPALSPRCGIFNSRHSCGLREDLKHTSRPRRRTNQLQAVAGNWFRPQPVVNPATAAAESAAAARAAAILSIPLWQHRALVL